MFALQPMARRMHTSRLLQSLLLCAALAACAGVAHAGAWVSPKGAFYAKISYGASSANDQFGFDGVTKPLVEGLSDYPFADRSFYLYSEYGLTDVLTVTAMVPYKRVFVHDKLFKYSTMGVADIGLGARYLVYSADGWVGSVSGSLSIPTPYHRDYQPPLGAGQIDVGLAANLGRSLWPLPAYATATVGLRYRTGIYTSSVSDKAATNPFFKDHVDYANDLVYMVEGGWTFFNHVLVHLVVSGAMSLRADGNAFTITSVPSTQQYLKIGPGMTVGFLDRYEVSADVATTVIGKNTSKSIDIFLGAGVKF